jgi:hypothetical protein
MVMLRPRKQHRERLDESKEAKAAITAPELIFLGLTSQKNAVKRLLARALEVYCIAI